MELKNNIKLARELDLIIFGGAFYHALGLGSYTKYYKLKLKQVSFELKPLVNVILRQGEVGIGKFTDIYLFKK